MGGTVEIHGDNLVFELHGVDEIFAIKRSVSVPLEHVVSVSTDNVGWEPFKQLRVGGTSLPGVIKDGRYLSSDGMMFFEMHHPERCVTVTLDHDTYRKIVFEVDDKEKTAKMINVAVAQRKRPAAHSLLTTGLSGLHFMQATAPKSLTASVRLSLR